jgi:hypothetical protein
MVADVVDFTEDAPFFKGKDFCWVEGTELDEGA